MKKEYVKPVMTGEQFVADEYVSACWYGECNISGMVYEDTNHNKTYDENVDEWVYTNSACGEQFSITGIDNEYRQKEDLTNAFVVTKKWKQDDILHGHWETISSTPVYFFGGQHVATIDSIRKNTERPNHS